MALKQGNTETDDQRGIGHLSEPTTPENTLAIGTALFSGGEEN